MVVKCYNHTMQRYEILPHTADLAVRMIASTKEGLLAAAVQGMFTATNPSFPPGVKKIERPFTVVGSDFPTLFINILNEAIFFSSTHHEAYDDVHVTDLTEKEARGSFIGKPITRFETEIKAATFHDLHIGRNEEGQWETTVIFDV